MYSWWCSTVASTAWLARRRVGVELHIVLMVF
jgi:hypothetical protein